MYSRRAIAHLAALSCLAFSTALHAESETGDRFITFSGFGSIGVAHNQGDGSTFIRDITEPNGARNNGWYWDVDSRIGLQANIKATDNFEGVVQIISRYTADNNFQPELNWGFLKYTPNDMIDARAGRVAFDAFLAADSRDVGFSYLWVRPPVEYYGTIPVPFIDGGDVVFRMPVASGVSRLKLYSGVARQHVPTHLNQTQWMGMPVSVSAGAVEDLSGSRVTGGFVDYQDTHWTARIGEAQIRVSREFPIGLFDPIGTMRGTAASIAANAAAAGYPAPPIVTSLNTLANDFSLPGKNIKFTSIGLAYENGPLQTQAALSHFTSESLAFPESHSGYVSVGYRFGKFTPYAMISAVRSKKISRADDLAKQGTGMPGIDSIAGMANFILSTGQDNQHTYSIGMRYDLTSNMALKVQLDRIQNRDCSPVSLPTPGATLTPCSPPLLWQTVPVSWDGRANVYSAVLDFTF